MKENIKLTADEIIKVLQCCSIMSDPNCLECPLHKKDCMNVNVDELAVEVFENLKAEIAGLKEQLDGETVENMRLGHEIERLEELNKIRENTIDALIAGQESLTNYINVLLEEKGGVE